MRLTKRQFVEWKPAMLAAELSTGKTWMKPDIRVFLKYFRHMPFGEFKEKLKIILDANIDGVLFRWDIIKWIDKNLPLVLFDLIIDKVFEKHEEKNLLSLENVTSIDNILSLLSRGISPKFIHWNVVWPLSRLQELKHVAYVIDESGNYWWNEGKKSHGNRLTDLRRVILMGIPPDYICRFSDVFEAAKYGKEVGGYYILGWSCFDDVISGYLWKIIRSGLFIVIKGVKGNIFAELLHEKSYGNIIEKIIENKMSYCLFDRGFKYGMENRKMYLSANPTVDIEKLIREDSIFDGYKYRAWLRLIDQEKSWLGYVS